MAIVTGWQRPLEESLEAILQNPDATLKDLEEVRNTLSMLCEGESVKVLYEKIDEAFRQREASFHEAAEQIKNGKTRKEVEDAVSKIRSLDTYEDKTEILRLGEDRLEAFRKQEQNEEKAKKIRSRKRGRKIAIAAIACTGAVALAIALFVCYRNAKFNEMKEQLQAMTHEGNADEIMEQLHSMEGYYATNDELYSSYETVLEEVAVNHSFEAAFVLQDKLISKDSSLKKYNRLTFDEWSEKQLNDPALSPEDSWQIARHSLEQNRLKSSDSKVMGAFNAYFKTIVEAVEQEKADSFPDINTWVQENRPYLVTMPVDPDLALRLCYSLESSGMDLKALFPDGIAVDIPIGASVGSLNAYFRSGGEGDPAAPDMSKMLPIAVVESTLVDDDKIYDIAFEKQKNLETYIYGLQEEDSHYNFFLLPEYLMDIPEEMRAGSFEECTSVLAMQQLWILSSFTYQSSSTRIGSFSVPVIGSATDYRGSYLSLDCVAVFDLSAQDHYFIFEFEGDEPKLDEDGWFEMHKNDPGIYTDENMLGKHEPEWLKEKYEETLDALPFYQFLLSLSGGQQESGTDLQLEAPGSLL